MMQGRSAALSSKYDIYLVPNFTDMHYVLLNSHRKMVHYYINNIRKDLVFFKLKGWESEKLLFNIHFLNWDISVNNKLRTTKSRTPIDDTNMQGTVSQVFGIGLSFYFIKCRKMSLKKFTKSSRFLS